MAFTLQNKSRIKSVAIGMVATLAIAATLVINKTPSDTETFKTSGHSMLPNYWPEQLIVGTTTFDNIERDSVYMTSDDKYRQVLGEQSTNSVSTKRVVGMPGDSIVFDVHSGQMLSINNQVVNYTVAKNYSSFKVTDKVSSTSLTTSPMLQRTLSGGHYMTYQLTEAQQHSASAKEKDLIQKYTQYGFLKGLPLDARGHVTVVLGADEYFLLSDNRVVGVDSRYYGPVARSEFLFSVATLPAPELAKINGKATNNS